MENQDNLEPFDGDLITSKEEFSSLFRPGNAIELMRDEVPRHAHWCLVTSIEGRNITVIHRYGGDDYRCPFDDDEIEPEPQQSSTGVNLSKYKISKDRLSKILFPKHLRYLAIYKCKENGETCRAQSVEIAENLLNDRGYHILFDNCEHFVSLCCNGYGISSQVINVLLNFFTFVVLIALSPLEIGACGWSWKSLMAISAINLFLLFFSTKRLKIDLFGKIVARTCSRKNWSDVKFHLDSMKEVERWLDKNLEGSGNKDPLSKISIADVHKFEKQMMPALRWFKTTQKRLPTKLNIDISELKDFNFLAVVSTFIDFISMWVNDVAENPTGCICKRLSKIAAKLSHEKDFRVYPWSMNFMAKALAPFYSRIIAEINDDAGNARLFAEFVQLFDDIRAELKGGNHGFMFMLDLYQMGLQLDEELDINIVRLEREISDLVANFKGNSPLSRINVAHAHELNNQLTSVLNYLSEKKEPTCEVSSQQSAYFFLHGNATLIFFISFWFKDATDHPTVSICLRLSKIATHLSQSKLCLLLPSTTRCIAQALAPFVADMKCEIENSPENDNLLTNLEKVIDGQSAIQGYEDRFMDMLSFCVMILTLEKELAIDFAQLQSEIAIYLANFKSHNPLSKLDETCAHKLANQLVPALDWLSMNENGNFGIKKSEKITEGEAYKFVQFTSSLIFFISLWFKHATDDPTVSICMRLSIMAKQLSDNKLFHICPRVTVSMAQALTPFVATIGAEAHKNGENFKCLEVFLSLFGDRYIVLNGQFYNFLGLLEKNHFQAHYGE